MTNSSHDLQFRLITRQDFSLFAAWIKTEHVAKWWLDPTDLIGIENEYGPVIDGLDPMKAYIVEIDGTPIGMIQFYLLSDEPGWAEANRQGVPNSTDVGGIDYIIGDPNFVGHGVGTFMIKAFVQKMFVEHSDVHTIISDPQQENLPSWKALEGAGFERIFAGMLISDDPSDSGLAFIYKIDRGK